MPAIQQTHQGIWSGGRGAGSCFSLDASSIHTESAVRTNSSMATLAVLPLTVWPRCLHCLFYCHSSPCNRGMCNKQLSSQGGLIHFKKS